MIFNNLDGTLFEFNSKMELFTFFFLKCEEVIPPSLESIRNYTIKSLVRRGERNDEDAEGDRGRLREKGI